MPGQIGGIPYTAVDEPNGSDVSKGWKEFFSAAQQILFAVSQSGTTAQRPTQFLWVGRPYFDTTLGFPVWWTGPAVPDWVDSTGAPA